VRYDIPVKAKTKPSTEYGRLQSALRSVLQVSKSDLNQMLAEDKIANQGKPKRGPKPKHYSSDRAADDKDSSGS
jgi:hypothetical protein